MRDGLQELEILYFKTDRRPPQLADCFETGWRSLHVLVTLKITTCVRHDSFSDDDSFDLAKEIGMPERSAKFAISNPAQADLFLHFDDVANTSIFDST